MYLHLGLDVVVAQEDVIGVFDMDNASWSHRTREFLEWAEREGRVVNASSDLPKSFVVWGRGREGSLVYLSQLSASTLKGRAEAGWME